LSNVNLVGVLAGDQGRVSASGTTGAFVDRNAGTNKVVTGSGVTLSGTEAGNYQFDTSAQIAQADINPRLISGTARIGDRPYDGTLVAPLLGITLNGVLAVDQVTATGQARYESASSGSGKPVSIEGLQLLGDDARNYRLDLGLLTGTGSVTPIATPTALIAPAQGVNGTAVATNGLAEGARQSEVVGPVARATITQLALDLSTTPPNLGVAADTILTGSLLRRGGVNTSFAYEGAPAAQPMRNELALYRQTSGQAAQGLGTYQVQDYGNDLQLTQQNTLRQSVPDVSGSSGPWIEGQALETNGGLLPLSIKLLGDGTLLVQASAASNLTDEEWASYGLILAKSRLNTSVTALKAVVIRRPDASASRSIPEDNQHLATR